MSVRTFSQQKLTNSVYNKTKTLLGGSALFTPVGNGSSSGNYLDVGNQSALKLGSGNFTVETWIKRTASLPYTSICGDGSFVWFTGGTGAELLWYAGSTGILVSNSTFSANTWTHIAAVRNSGTLTFYINGTAAGSATDSTNYNTTNAFQIGITPAGVGRSRYYNGYLSGLRIVGSAVYTSNFTPDKRLLSIANTVLLTLQNSDKIVDNGPNAYTITNNGSVTPSSDRPT